MPRIYNALKKNKNLEDFIVEVFSGSESVMEIGSQDNDRSYQIWKELGKPRKNYHVAEHEITYKKHKKELKQIFKGANVYGVGSKNLAGFLSPKPDLLYAINFLSYQDEADLEKRKFPILDNLLEYKHTSIVFIESESGEESMAKSGSMVYETFKQEGKHVMVDFLKNKGFRVKELPDAYVIYKE